MLFRYPYCTVEVLHLVEIISNCHTYFPIYPCIMDCRKQISSRLPWYYELVVYNPDLFVSCLRSDCASRKSYGYYFRQPFNIFNEIRVGQWHERAYRNKRKETLWFLRNDKYKIKTPGE